MKRPGDITMAAALAVVVLSVLPFLQTLRFGLVWDDSLLLTQLAGTAASGGVKRLFASDFRLRSDWPMGYYRPVTTTALWWQIRRVWKTGGTDALPQAARRLHAENLFLHAVSSLLVWFLLRRLTGRGWAAWLGAALFAVHPSHVEPVAFVSARTDLLAAVFVLGSLLCWLESRRATGAVRVAALMVGSLLALAGSLAKEQALLLPVVLGVWSWLLRGKGSDGWRHNRGWVFAWFFAAALALLLRTQVAHVGFGPGEMVPGSGSPAGFVRFGLPALVLYLKLWFFPWPLNAYYTGYQVDGGWLGVAGVAATVLLVIFAVRHARGREALAAVCFTLVFLLPVLHLVPLQGAVASERYLYLPSAGLALLTSMALVALERRQWWRVAGRAVVGLGIVACVLLATKGARSWASDATLFARMVETSPRAPAAHLGLGDVFAKAGKYPDAVREYRTAIQLRRDYTDAYMQLGIASATMGEYAAARAALEVALRIEPNRASIHTDLGVLSIREGRIAASLPHFRRAAELDPTSARRHFDLGRTLALTGDAEGATREAAILDQLDPEQARLLRQEIQSRMGTETRPAR